MTAPFPDTCENPEIFTKYKSAADVINSTSQYRCRYIIDLTCCIIQRLWSI